VVASVTKTFTATAMMCLVTDGRVELQAPVQRYLPDFALAGGRDDAARITVLNLLNHTAGLDWRIPDQPDDSDSALASYVAALRDCHPIAAPGALVSYSQTGYNVAGRIIEVVTEMTYEHAIARLLLEPLNLRDSTFRPRQAIAGPVAMGHNVQDDGMVTVAQQWKDTRANNPGGGLATSVSDLLRWARFHLGDGGQVLPKTELGQMRHPTAKLIGSSLGDAVGIGWFLRDIGGAHAFGHAGSANGQFADVLIIPDKDFAVVTIANSGPDNGLAFNHEIIQAGLESVAKVTAPRVKVMRYKRHVADEYAGVYENEMMHATFTSTGKALTAEFAIKPGIRASATTELPPDMPAAPIALLHGEQDQYMVTGGGLKGQRGYFSRDKSDRIITVTMAGRVFTRI
jgi:CubicO group peptidase (beta-lactamase class C family)